MRRFCEDEFREAGLNTQWSQTNYSTNRLARTLRGFHYQTAPRGEVKLVSCVSGAIEDALLDLRPESESCGRSVSVRLAADDSALVYVAKGVAHAYLTLEDNSSVLYQVSEPYSRAHTAGVQYTDPVVNIDWPIEPRIISVADQSWPPCLP